MNFILHFIKTRRWIGVISGSILILAGLSYTIPALYFHYSHYGTVSIPANSDQISSHLPSTSSVSAAASVQQTPIISGIPVNIDIPSLNINLPVVNGYYNSKTGAWNVSDTAAQYATPSVPINNTAGNTLIYGHYRKSVFAYLHLIKPGATLTVTTANGYLFTYRFVQTYPTQPTDTSVFTYNGPAMLTVQTCSGAFFQNRQMFQFALVGYQETSNYTADIFSGNYSL